jgi:hypothetical protein
VKVAQVEPQARLEPRKAARLEQAYPITTTSPDAAIDPVKSWSGCVSLVASDVAERQSDVESSDIARRRNVEARANR